MAKTQDDQPPPISKKPDEIASRIAELEGLIKPLQKELSTLKRRLSAIRAGQSSAKARRDEADIRHAQIERVLQDNADDLYKRPEGLIKKTAREQGVSVRTVSKIRNRKNRQ